MAGTGKRKKVGDSAPSDDDAWMDEIITELRDGDYDDTGVVKTMTTQATITRKGEGTSKGSMGEVAGKGGIIENTGMGEVAGKGNENTDKGKAKSAHNVKAKSAGVPVWGCEYIGKGGVAGKGGMAAVPVAEYTGKGGLRRGRVVYMAAGNDEIWQEAMEVYHREMADAGKGGMAAGKGDMPAGKGGINENAGKGDMAADKGGKGEVTGKGDMAEGKGAKGEVTLPLKGDGKGNFFLQPAPIVGMTRPRRVAAPGMPGSHLEGIPEAHIWHAEAQEDIPWEGEPDRIQPTHIIQIPLNMAQGNTRTHIEVADVQTKNHPELCGSLLAAFCLLEMAIRGFSRFSEFSSFSGFVMKSTMSREESYSIFVQDHSHQNRLKELARVNQVSLLLSKSYQKK